MLISFQKKYGFLLMSFIVYTSSLLEHWVSLRGVHACMECQGIITHCASAQLSSVSPRALGIILVYKFRRVLMRVHVSACVKSMGFPLTIEYSSTACACAIVMFCML